MRMMQTTVSSFSHFIQDTDSFTMIGAGAKI